MESQQHYYVTKLKEELSLRQRSTPSYSIRAYARDLQIDSSSLSKILAGKRAISVKSSKDLARRLNLNPKEATLFIESINRSHLSIDQIQISPLDERFMLDESFHKALAEWEHYAILELFDIEDFEPSTSYMMKKLKLNENRVEVVLNNLLTCGLLVRDSSGELIKAHPDIRTTEDAQGEALNQAHLEELELARVALTEVSKELRDFSSSTLAIDLDKLSEAKTIIREFRQKMTALMKQGEKTDVYMLSLQFYPLTEPEEPSTSL